MQPIDGNAPRQVTNFESDLTYDLALSRDGKQLALARGANGVDAFLITNFQ
ncbi:MAG TPA: hypothetical protein VKD91_01365 [Pyrinomonadaceae bacterium]|nr:hypothetical protein [Pyrinomonadaceae bacterium]